MGPVHAQRRERRQTSAALTRAAALFAGYGDRLDEATCWRLLGELNATHDDPAAARAHLTRALHLWQAFDAEDRVAQIRTRLRELDDYGGGRG